jgi:hypothetical protein
VEGFIPAPLVEKAALPHVNKMCKEIETDRSGSGAGMNLSTPVPDPVGCFIPAPLQDQATLPHVNKKCKEIDFQHRYHSRPSSGKSSFTIDIYIENQFLRAGMKPPPGSWTGVDRFIPAPLLEQAVDIKAALPHVNKMSRYQW